MPPKRHPAIIGGDKASQQAAQFPEGAGYMIGFQDQGLAAQGFGSGLPATGPGSISHMMGLQAMDTLTDSYGSGMPPPGARIGGVEYLMNIQEQNGMALAQSFGSGAPVQLNREGFTTSFDHGRQSSADGTPSQALDSIGYQKQNSNDGVQGQSTISGHRRQYSNDNSRGQQQLMPIPRLVASPLREFDAPGNVSVADTSALGAQVERYVEAPNLRDIAMKRPRGLSSYTAATPDAEGDVPMSMTDAPPAPKRYHRAPGQLLDAQVTSSHTSNYQSPYHKQGQWTGSPVQSYGQLMVPPSPLGFPPVDLNFPQPPNSGVSARELQSPVQMQPAAQGAPSGFERQNTHQRGVGEMSPALGSQSFESALPAQLHPAIRRLSFAGQAKPPIPAPGLGLNMDSLSSGPRGLPTGGERNMSSRYNESGLRMPSQGPSSEQGRMRSDVQGYRSSQPNPTKGDLSLLSARVSNLSARMDAGFQTNPQAYLPGYVSQNSNGPNYQPSLFLPNNLPGKTFGSQLQNSSGMMNQMDQAQTSRSFSPQMVYPQLSQPPMANPGSFSPSLSNYQSSSHPNPLETLSRSNYLRIPEQRTMNQTHPSMGNPGTFSPSISNNQPSANSSTREKQSKVFERYPSLQMPTSSPPMNQMGQAQAPMGNPGSFPGGVPNMQPSLNHPSAASQSSESFGPSTMQDTQPPTDQMNNVEQSRARAGSLSYGLQQADPSMNPMYKETPSGLNSQSFGNEESKRGKVSLKERRAQATAKRNALRNAQRSPSMSSTPLLNMNSITQGHVSHRNAGDFPAGMSSPHLSMNSMAQGPQPSDYAPPSLDYSGNVPPSLPIKRAPPKATVEALMGLANAESPVPGVSTSPLSSPQFYPAGELDPLLIQSGFGMLDPARITTGLPQHEIDRAMPSARAQISINRARQGIIPLDLASLSTPDLQKLAAEAEAETKAQGHELGPNPSTDYLLRMIQAVEQYRNEASSASIRKIPLNTASNSPTEQTDPITNFYRSIHTDSNVPRGIGLRQIENTASAPNSLSTLLAKRRNARREPLGRVLELTESVIDNLNIDLQEASETRAQQERAADHARESNTMADKQQQKKKELADKEEQMIKEFADKYLRNPDGSAMNWEVGLGMDIPNPPGFKPITEPMPLHEKKKDRLARQKDFEEEITHNLGYQTSLANSMNAYQEGARSDGKGN